MSPFSAGIDHLQLMLTTPKKYTQALNAIEYLNPSEDEQAP